MSLVENLYVRARAVGDTLYNFVSGLGTAKDPRTSTRFVYHELNRTVLEHAYRSDWMARRIVDLPAEDATREWRTWTASADQIEKIDALEKKLELQKKLRMALIRARLYGGGALVIGVDQGQPEDELDLDDVGLNDLKWVVVVNRYELSAGPRIYNVDSQWYTRPEYYTVSTPMFGFYGEEGGAYPQNVTSASVMPSRNAGQGGAPLLPDKNRQVQPSYGMVRVHPSRVIEFAGNELPDWRLAPMGGGWGDSVLQTVNDSLRDFAMIMGGLASIINDMKLDVVKIPELSRKLSTADMTQKTIERFGLANMAKSTINTLLLDKDEEWQRIQTSFGSTPDLIRVAMTVACAAGGIPESRIMGNAPNKGLASQGNSGGEVDIRNYYDDIASSQKSKYKPMLTPLDRCVQQSALGKYDPSIDYTWDPLYQPTAQEAATMALTKAQTTQVYVTTGLINEDALREAVISQLSEDKIYPGLEDAIDEFGSEPEEPEAPQMQLPPTPPPGMMPKGQFEANPFHMLRAQGAQAKGLPVRVPPNKPQLPKFGPAPPGFQAKDASPAKVADFDPNEPRDPHGEWTTVGNYGLVPGDAEKFKALKDEWAKVNDEMLGNVDRPDAPEEQAKLQQLEGIVHQMHALHADPGGAAGMGLPGGPRDVTIVGAGPGGLTAGIHGGVEGLDTLIVEGNAKAGGQAKYSSRIENFPGFPVGVTGKKLTQDMFEQAERVGAETKLGARVTGMTVDKDGMKHLTLSDGETIDSRTVILAGGVEFRHLTFPGSEGPGVIVGDGEALTNAANGGSAVVVGGSNGAAQAALGAATKADHVYLLSHSPIAKGMSDYQIAALHNQPKITVIENDGVAKMNRDAAGNPESIETTRGQKLPAKALGVFIGSVPETNWLSGSGVELDEGGRIHTDDKMETAVPGVYAIGDMRSGAIGRIGVATGEGMLALREAYNHLDKARRAATGIKATDELDEDDDISDLTSRLFDLDRANPWFGQTVEPDSDELADFNPYHDKLGRFSSAKGVAHEEGTEAVGKAIGGGKASKRSVSAKAAHARRKARLAEAFPLPANATPKEAGLTAVSRAIAIHKGHPTKGEIAKAAKADVINAVEAFAATQHLKTPATPPGMDPQDLKTKFHVGVAIKKFFADRQSRQIITQAISRNSFTFMQKAAKALPAHTVTLLHHTLVDKIADYTHEAITDAILTGIGGAATAVGGPIGLATATAASPLLHSEIETAVDKIGEKVGFTPEHIREVLHGIGHALIDHYRKWRQTEHHLGRRLAHAVGQSFFESVDADPDQPKDIIEAALMALADVLGENDEEDLP